MGLHVQRTRMEQPLRQETARKYIGLLARQRGVELPSGARQRERSSDDELPVNDT